MPAWRFDVLWIQRHSSAYVGCNKWITNCCCFLVSSNQTGHTQTPTTIWHYISLQITFLAYLKAWFKRPQIILTTSSCLNPSSCICRVIRFNEHLPVPNKVKREKQQMHELGTSICCFIDFSNAGLIELENSSLFLVLKKSHFQLFKCQTCLFQHHLIPLWQKIRHFSVTFCQLGMSMHKILAMTWGAGAEI